MTEPYWVADLAIDRRISTEQLWQTMDTAAIRRFLIDSGLNPLAVSVTRDDQIRLLAQLMKHKLVRWYEARLRRELWKC